MSIILKAENISKQYRLGKVGTGTLSHDLNRWWHGVRGKEDPYLKIGAVNDRSSKATEDYIWALRDINFEVKTGEVLGIIGKNGAGKTTLLKILSRVTSPTTGYIKTKGRIASLLEVGTGFHGELTGRENIFMNGAVLGMTKTEIKRKLDEIIDFSGCEMYIDTPVKRYSSGMTVRLGFAVAAHLEPEILVVDEVLAVGDAEFQKKAIGKMQDLSHGEGRTVLFVSHNMASVKSLCDRGIVLENGTSVFDGETENAINCYLSDEKQIIQKDLSSIRDRSGTGIVKFRSFQIEHRNGQIIENVLNGDTIKFSFKIDVRNLTNISNIDLGFSIHTLDDELITVLYNSYQNKTIQVTEDGEYTIKCVIPELALNEGAYIVKGRIECDKIESDWPKEPLGKFIVIKGDFYKTGNLGFNGKSKLLIKGEWDLVN
ncbi:lipopolysaccharide transport system ATP-binding protein [Gillisia sp. Hel_I_86]|uniref:ABC transporter ATP-binding protein n=1 Tax=Gillisia sp. Hel_I_86 TaxID=1249981 RepID=UPI00119BEC94|nr:ABC transporter ATP-binding protein [Gillisia sp. Hel_I_86]TVZ25585.1 lipopolysaccharide transport system ATP-binding protein [Gillisia sp. Hel_I_86]